MQDNLFPETWPLINVEEYIQQHELAFDQVDLKMLPHYTLIDKIKLGALLAILLLNDPLKQERERLNEAVLTEVQRQISLLVAEYNLRIERGLVAIDSQAKTFLAKHIKLATGSDSLFRPPVVVGLNTLELAAKRG